VSELLALTIAEASGGIAADELSVGDYLDAWAGAAAGDELNAYLWRRDGSAKPRSDGSVGGELAGVPIAIKDLFCTEGVPTTAGSKILESYRPPFTATAVRKLMDAGAEVLGKTNMDEFGMGSSNENSGYGPVLNPWDRGRVPGGSSGGSAAAVAAGLAPGAIGTDTGGSIRQPASLCGTLTRDVTDAALLLRAMEGRDKCDSTSVGIDGELELPSRTDLAGLRFGVPRELSSEAEGIETGVAAAFERALGLIRELGAEVEECELPHAAHGLSAYYVLAPAEASTNLARYDGVRYGLRLDSDGDADLVAMYEATRDRGFGPEVKRRIMLGTYALSAGYYEAYYGRAQRVRTRIVEDFANAFASFDYLVSPTSPTVAFELGARAENPLAMYMSDYCTVPMSLAGIPAISIPAGLAAPDGGGPDLPVGLQVAAPAFGEAGLLEAAHAIEAAIGFEGLDHG
jgi:aspartyl-tRNA(Asn)/glutamyl-tRNA(Gln) amidotransferase subunit A